MVRMCEKVVLYGFDVGFPPESYNFFSCNLLHFLQICGTIFPI